MSQLNDILGEVVSVRIDKDQMNNNTVKALVVNDLVGEALEHYGEALGVSEEQHNDESHNETSTHKQRMVQQANLLMITKLLQLKHIL